MANMGYCRFENTLYDLRDCYENWEEADSPSEKKAQAQMLKLCQRIVADYGDDDVSNAIFAATGGKP